MTFNPRGVENSGPSFTRRLFAKWAAVASGLLFTGDVQELTAGGTKRAGTQPLLPTNMPAPKHIPSSFRWVRTDIGRPDGFRASTDEVALWYVHARAASAAFNPLIIYISPATDRPLVLTENTVKQVLNVQRNNGAFLSADYYNGYWKQSSPMHVHFDASNVHTLVFSIDGFRIGIRGARVVGVGLDAMLEIARSM